MTKTEGFITSLFRKGAVSDSRAARFTDATRLECGSCKLQFQIPIGTPFEIEASTDLREWSVILQTSSDHLTVDYVDTDAMKFRTRFYRISAQAQRSQNIMGFASLKLPRGFRMISNPFNARNNAVAALFPEMPDGTTLCKFDTTLCRLGNNPVKEGHWAHYDDTLLPGDGAIFFNPGPEERTVVFIGQVLEKNLQNVIPTGFSICSSQLPLAGRLDTDLGFPLSPGDVVHTFDSIRQKYRVHHFGTADWDEVPPRIGIGESFWVGKSAVCNWTQKFPAT